MSYFHPTLTDWTLTSDSDDTEDDPDYIPPAPKARRQRALGRQSLSGTKIVDYVRLITDSEDEPINFVSTSSGDDVDTEEEGGQSGNGDEEKGCNGEV